MEIVTLLLNILFLVLGFAFLIKGADIFVDGASAIAKILKVPALIIGLTIVALGTSLPELAVRIVAAVNNSTDLSVSNVVGSNIFNIILILGFCSILTPATVTPNALLDVIVALFSGVVVFIFAFKSNKINRWQGVVMVSMYALYLTFLVLRELSIF